jgi:adenylyltransferase/sulfurtransferase
MEITPEELSRELLSEQPPCLLDVREDYEREISKLANDIHIPMSELGLRFSELDPAVDTVVYCRSGARSGRVVQFLAGQGYKVRNLVGGINRWATEVDPSMPVY